MESLSNLDPWTYHAEQRGNDFARFMDQLGVAKPTTNRNIPTDPVANITVDPAAFWNYVVSNQSSCQKKWFHPRSFLSDSTNYEMRLPSTVGRHQGNTTEYNWGLNDNTNEEVKQLIGIENLESAGFVPSTVLSRLIVYMPGHGIPWHRDSLDGWRKKFAHLNPAAGQEHCDLGPVRRHLLTVSAWHWGHMLQVGNSVLTHWSSGDVYDIPLGKWHLSANQGILPKMTVSLTGVIKS